MIKELSDLGKRIREEKAKEMIVHDALKEEPVGIDLLIKNDGSFCGFVTFEKKLMVAEAISAKKGKARLLLDKAEEVLGIGKDCKKHQLYREKLDSFSELEELKPVFMFFKDNKKNGFDMAKQNFKMDIPEKEQSNNIAFRILDEEIRIHEKENVYQAIIKRYEDWETGEIEKHKWFCSICGKDDFPVVDLPHGKLKRVPDGQTAGCALVSYNDNAYLSYNQKGILNSKICTHCAITYVDGLNWLLNNGQWKQTSKEKKYFEFSNRKNISSNTAFVFWTRSNTPIKEIELLEQKQEDIIFDFVVYENGANQESSGEDLKLVLNSPARGKNSSLKSVEADFFYGITLSGAAARIAVRDWIEISVKDMHDNLNIWFEDIAINQYEKNDKRKLKAYKKNYYPIKSLSNCCAVHKKDSNGNYKCDYNDPTIGAAGTALWKAALKNKKPPINILSTVLRRIKAEGGRITGERAALIKLVLIRHNFENNKGGLIMKDELDTGNKSTAYTCGVSFPLLKVSSGQPWEIILMRASGSVFSAQLPPVRR